MATHVQRAWDRMRESVSGSSVRAAEEFRAWMTNDLIEVSKKLPPLLRQCRKDEAWRSLFEKPLGDFAIRTAAWDELLASIGPSPPSFDPVQLLDWAKGSLWSLCVFIDPDDACDNDQFGLELWWSEEEQQAVFVCGLGDRFEFKRRSATNATERHSNWAGNPDALRPAPRSVVVELFPDIELLS